MRQSLTDPSQHHTSRTSAEPCLLPAQSRETYFTYIGNSENKAGLGGSLKFCRVMEWIFSSINPKDIRNWKTKNKNQFHCPVVNALLYALKIGLLPIHRWCVWFLRRPLPRLQLSPKGRLRGIQVTSTRG